MDEHPQRRSRDLERQQSRDSVRRRLETPGRGELRPATRSRSRSRLRTRSPSRLHREPGLGQSLERIELLERELQRERQRVEAASRRRSSPRRVSEHREEHRHRSSSRRSGAVPPVEQRREHRNDGDLPRSRSPSFSKRDVIDILNSIKCGLPSQPSAQAAPHQKLDHKNILPNFDPSTKNQRIDVWLKKVNECASVYGWDERTTTHFAMQKLQGLAKTWYEGLNSILFTWQQWQDKLVNAFPYEQNYGQALEDMLKRKSRFNEPIEVYFYEKQTLVNQCDIVGKRAVDCIIHGLTDRTLRSGALALRCTDPDQLLQYLVSNKDSQRPAMDRTQFKNGNNSSTNGSSGGQSQRAGDRNVPPTGCYNCKEKGHSFMYCPKPLLKCTRCQKIGHLSDVCRSNPKNPENIARGQVGSNSGHTDAVKKTMCIDSFETQ
ncbi:unnamed protein product [Plutella xylostella]|uniref:(diamondback moth) hypothetical protein n=1 Tax=Plutella xylostella TaxID=51655 RepID=A0A8S4FW69_PLUXY|nr:unnamed protein product [Plutella xylostella]